MQQTVTLTPQQAATLLGNQPQIQQQVQRASVPKKIFGIIAVVATAIATVLFWIATGIEEVGVGLMIGIMVAPTAFIAISCILILVSLFKERTTYGLSITPLVFACLTTLGGFITFIMFALFTSSYCDSYYSSSSYCTTYGATLAGAAFLMGGQITIIVLSSTEIRRVPKTTQQIIIIQAPGGYPVQTQMVANGQPVQMAYAQPVYTQNQVAVQ